MKSCKQTFVGVEGGVDVLQGVHHPVFVHEGQQSHSLPGVFLPVQIYLEVFRVEVYDVRFLCGSNSLLYRCFYLYISLLTARFNTTGCGSLVSIFILQQIINNPSILINYFSLLRWMQFFFQADRGQGKELHPLAEGFSCHNVIDFNDKLP